MTTETSIQTDIERKVDRLRTYVDRMDATEVWLGRAENFGWLLDADNQVSHSSEPGIAAVGVDEEDVTVLTSNIEASRLRAEEVPEDLHVVDFDWFESSIVDEIEARADGPVVADIDVPGAERVDPAAFRLPLTPRDVERFRDLGATVAAGLETTCRRIDPTDTEREVAADVIGELANAGVEAPVALVGGADRAQRFRHYTPQDVPIGEYALVSVSARRHGAWISATRTVALDPPAWLPAHHSAAMRVEASAIAASRAHADSGTAGDVFAAIQRAYEVVGFPGEWRHHHQGGASGFAGREWFGSPENPRFIDTPVTFAWNPTVQGAKSEDTVLVTAGHEIEVLTRTGEWPVTEVTAVGFDDTISRHEPLELE